MHGRSPFSRCVLVPLLPIPFDGHSRIRIAGWCETSPDHQCTAPLESHDEIISAMGVARFVLQEDPVASLAPRSLCCSVDKFPEGCAVRPANSLRTGHGPP